ncbi:hypothetical protein AB0C07_16850 [Actinoplanes missouriensis]|uniref:hypothetical protein n=1 Tax=Actinoplanes missouriensis TaxID=1866 RepID=UPI003406C575
MVADHATAQVLENLRARDAADEGDLIMSMVELVEEVGLLDRLVADVRASLSLGDWTPKDVAFRFLSVHQLKRPTRWSASIGENQSRDPPVDFGRAPHPNSTRWPEALRAC